MITIVITLINYIFIINIFFCQFREGEQPLTIAIIKIQFPFFYLIPEIDFSSTHTHTHVYTHTYTRTYTYTYIQLSSTHKLSGKLSNPIQIIEHHHQVLPASPLCPRCLITLMD